MPEIPRRKSVAVVGAGITGLAAAKVLAESGLVSVTVFEKGQEPGGLCAGFAGGDPACDQFYHVILPSDAETLAWVREFGLQGDLVWSKAGSGFYGRGRLVPFGSALDFLRFPFLSARQKFLLGRGILRACRVSDPRGPSARPAEAWLREYFGPEVTRKVWLPLLRSKFGAAAGGSSALLIWASIRRLRGARKGPSGRERLGALRGGIRSLVHAIERRLRADGVQIRLDTPVLDLMPEADGRISLRTGSGMETFDALLLASSKAEWPGRTGLPDSEPAPTERPEAPDLGIVEIVLALKKQLSPFYVINLLDETLPFTGIIEMTNVVPLEEFGGYHIVYLPKYVTPDDPLNRLTDAEAEERFRAGLRGVFPDLRDEEIASCWIVRHPHVQPIPRPCGPDTGRSSLSPWPGIFAADSSLIGESTPNVDASLRLARRVALEILAHLVRQPE